MAEVQALLRTLVRGEGEASDVVRQLGGSLQSETGGLRVELPPLPPVELSLHDLAFGLLTHWSTGTAFRDWANVVLMVSDIQFIEAESADEAVLLEALWAAAAGEPVADDAVALAQRLAR